MLHSVFTLNTPTRVYCMEYCIKYYIEYYTQYYIQYCILYIGSQYIECSIQYSILTIMNIKTKIKGERWRHHLLCPRLRHQQSHTRPSPHD